MKVVTHAIQPSSSSYKQMQRIRDRRDMLEIKGVRPVVILLLAFSFLSPSLAGLCPPGCHCDDKQLATTCSGGSLEIIPHFLNPAIRQLKANDNKIRKLEGSLNFYNKVPFTFYFEAVLVSFKKLLIYISLKVV